jgi:SPP1 gp7 family putative phage head morphogenesis protein
LVGGVFQQVDNADKFAWRQHSQNMSMALRKELDSTPVGDVVKEIMKQNVLLIKSIPLQTAERVHGLVQENMMQSRRPEEVAQMIMSTEDITRSRATLIARTEVSKASTTLTQARASYIGSSGYIWRTSGDAIVRKSHREMNGKFVKWEEPPELDGMTGHAACLPNCRCWCDVVIPGVEL